MKRYVVMVTEMQGGEQWIDYSGVQHSTKREAMHELAIAKTDRSVAHALIEEREVIHIDDYQLSRL